MSRSEIGKRLKKDAAIAIIIIFPMAFIGFFYLWVFLFGYPEKFWWKALTVFLSFNAGWLSGWGYFLVMGQIEVQTQPYEKKDTTLIDDIMP